VWRHVEKGNLESHVLALTNAAALAFDMACNFAMVSVRAVLIGSMGLIASGQEMAKDVGRLRGSATETAAETPKSAWDEAPLAAGGGKVAFAALIGIPAILLFAMLCAKKEGGFYPNFCACFVILMLFGYAMIESPYSYTCVEDLAKYFEMLGDYAKK